MTILLYEYCKLEERVSKSLKVWKAWHIIIYILIAVCGVLNFTFLQSTRQMVDDHCIFYPRHLTFHMVELTNFTSVETAHDNYAQGNETTAQAEDTNLRSAQDDANVGNNGTEEGEGKKERDIVAESLNDPRAVTIVVNNVTIIIANVSHHMMLRPGLSLFQSDYECQFAEFMPVVSFAFALIWITMFTMCPGGGRVTSGLQQPWRILAPALLFSLALVVLTGISFSQTNGGVQAFCAAFADYTNSTTCSSVDPFIERSYNASWGFGGRAAALRAASAGVWAGWACAAALLLARCLAAPDFAVQKTSVRLVKDPQQKIIPHLKSSPRRSARLSAPVSAPDTASVNSEPTASTQLVTASIHDQASEPPSLPTTPVRGQELQHALEMTKKESKMD